MEEQIEILRDELNRLTKDSECLHSENVIQISEKLDKLIYAYYSKILVT